MRASCGHTTRPDLCGEAVGPGAGFSDVRFLQKMKLPVLLLRLSKIFQVKNAGFAFLCVQYFSSVHAPTTHPKT